MLYTNGDNDYKGSELTLNSFGYWRYYEPELD